MKTFFSIWKTWDFGKRITVSVIILFLLSISTINVIVFNLFKSSYEQNEELRLKALGESNTVQIADWFAACQNEISTIASLPITKNFDHEALNEVLKSVSDRNDFYDSLFILDANGIGVVGVDGTSGDAKVFFIDEARNVDSSERAYYREGISGNEYISEPYVSSSTGDPVVAIVAPISVNSEVIGIAKGVIQLNTISKILSEGVRDDNTEIFVINQHGVPILKENSLLNIDSLTTLAAQSIRAKKSGVGFYKNALGNDVFGSFTYIQNLDWGLVIESSKVELVSYVYNVFYILAGSTIVVTILFGLILVWLVRKQIIKPLVAAIASLDNAGNQVDAASKEVAHANQHLAFSAKQHSVRIEETTSSIEKLSSQVKLNNNSTDAIEIEMGHAKDVVGIGLQSVDELIEAMTVIKNYSQETSKIIKTIDDIAFQTNLLALNAAVEAARAGEAGKGFAVVADEVRSLAQRSAEAAKNTSELIGKSQQSSDNGAELATITAEKWKQIAAHAGQAGTMVQEVSSATNEQASAVDKITSQMYEMDTIVQKNYSNSHETAGAAEELTEEATKLMHAVTKLRELVGGKSNSGHHGSRHRNVSKYTPNDFVEVPDLNYNEPTVDKIKSVNMAFE